MMTFQERLQEVYKYGKARNKSFHDQIIQAREQLKAGAQMGRGMMQGSPADQMLTSVGWPNPNPPPTREQGVESALMDSMLSAGMPSMGNMNRWSKSLGLNKVAPSEFKKSINLMPPDKKPFLTNYSEAEYANMQLSLDKSGTMGYALKPDGDLVSVFNQGKIKGAGAEMVLEAMDKGAKKLDCFDGFLSTNFYRDKLGWKPTGYSDKWNEMYAPKNWDYKKYGTPDVVYMEAPKKIGGK